MYVLAKFDVGIDLSSFNSLFLITQIFIDNSSPYPYIILQYLNPAEALYFVKIIIIIIIIII